MKSPIVHHFSWAHDPDRAWAVIITFGVCLVLWFILGWVLINSNARRDKW